MFTNKILKGSNMKTIIILLFVAVITTVGQEFTVDKISGTVKVLRDSSEEWQQVNINDKLSVKDLVLTEKKSFIQLSNNNQKFLLKDDAAIGLNYLKKVSKNDLILALALDEIRNVPKIKRNSLSKNTAVYGTDNSAVPTSQMGEDLFGMKKINGAKLLCEAGYRESSVIAAKEVFRNYPSIATDFTSRIYFVNVLSNLELYQESLSEITRIQKLTLTPEQNLTLKNLNDEINAKLLENN